MEQSLLVAISLLPLGLVAVVAYLMLTRKKKKPALALVTNESIKRMESLSSRMGQLNSESQRDEDADVPAVVKVSKKKARKKRRPARGKRK